MNYHNKIFVPVSNTNNGETSNNTIFHYIQEGHMLTAEYAGGNIVKGHIIGLVSSNGEINMRYQQLNTNGELMTGKCISKPVLMNNGKIRLHEQWEWTSGDQSKGHSIIEER